MKIIEAAILKDDVIYTGHRHCDIINQHLSGFFKGYEQGFITDTGQFVNRETAAQIAFENNQIKQNKIELFSEDLY